MNILDPRALPEKFDLLNEYDVDNLDKLFCHYGDDKLDIYQTTNVKKVVQ